MDLSREQKMLINGMNEALADNNQIGLFQCMAAYISHSPLAIQQTLEEEFIKEIVYDSDEDEDVIILEGISGLEHLLYYSHYYDQILFEDIDLLFSLLGLELKIVDRKLPIDLFEVGDE